MGPGRAGTLLRLYRWDDEEDWEVPPVGQAFQWMIGESSRLQEIRDLIVRAARSNFPVLITGETGVGKEICARAIHELSARATGPFVAVNCAAIPMSLAEAELFGYEAGAFTDASRSGRAGKFEIAHGGTLFLDEVPDMPLALQAKVLRTIQTSEVERIGAAYPVKVDVRIIAATNRDLKSLIGSNDFRADLYYRLNVIGIHIPPLRERRGDIPLLLDHYLTTTCRELGLPPKRLGPDLAERLYSYAWPGNVRELINIVKRLLISVDEPTITVAAAPPDLLAVFQPGLSADHPTDRTEIERRRLLEALERSGGNRSEAARLLGVHRSTLYAMLRRHRLPSR